MTKHLKYLRFTAFMLFAVSAHAQATEAGYAFLQQQCLTCHDIAAMKEKEDSPERVYQAITTTPAHKDLKLNDAQLRSAAQAASGRLFGTSTEGDAKLMPNQCPSNPPLADPATMPAWSGWGNDASNTRFQSAKAAGLTTEQVRRLKLKWAFGFPNAQSAWAQPTVVAGRVFVGSDAGWVYSLDASTGCVYWSYKVKSLMRNAISFGPITGHGAARYAVYFGDANKAYVYALDAQTGRELWVTRADEHFTSRVTGAPTLYAGRLFVPIASWEGFNAKQAVYPCCTSRGSVVELDANTGKQLWKYYTVGEPKPTRKNSIGTQLYAPSGVSVWTSPTIDPRRNAIYFGTGEAAAGPVPATSDAVVAVDIDSGKLLWSHQTQSNDLFLVGCPPANKPENCPEYSGPDWDIGNSPVLKTLENGKRVLVAATKNGNVFALDPDQKGAQLWNVNVVPGPGGFVWGGAADDKNIYYGLTSGGAIAVRFATGERIWVNPLPAPEGRGRSGNTAAVTAVPGVVFTGSTIGIISALSTNDGTVLWEFDTKKDFVTVNKVKANGNMMSSAGPVVAGGMLFVPSGYTFGSALGSGNVLLAFGPE